MKLLIAYDGTPGSRAALRDLVRCGLPDGTEAEVLTVATAGRASAARALLLDEARMLAAAGAEHVRAAFPKWKVTSGVVEGVADRAIVARAEETSADLIVVGTRGLSPDERASLGSVARGVSTDSRKSVRVSRARGAVDATHMRLLAGFDGSPGAEDAVGEILRRRWPHGTAVRLVTVRGDAGRADEDLAGPLAHATKRLAKAGLTVDGSERRGDPGKALLDEAAAWEAHTIFLGGRRLQRLRRFLFGSVAGSVADDAPCSVEVVRLPDDGGAREDPSRERTEKPSDSGSRKGRS